MYKCNLKLIFFQRLRISFERSNFDYSSMNNNSISIKIFFCLVYNIYKLTWKENVSIPAEWLRWETLGKALDVGPDFYSNSVNHWPQR